MTHSCLPKRERETDTDRDKKRERERDRERETERKRQRETERKKKALAKRTPSECIYCHTKLSSNSILYFMICHLMALLTLQT